MKGRFSTIPNQLSLLRLLLVPVLWVLAFLQLRMVFGIVFVLATITDWLDGTLARKLKLCSEFGAWLDSLADNVLYASVPVWLWWLLPEVVIQHFTLLVFLLALFVLSMVIGYIRYKQMVSYHMISDKAAAVFLYGFIAHAILFSPNTIFLYVSQKH